MFIGNNKNFITPCVGLCYMDADNICMGCYRTSAEISDWMHKTEDEQISITIRCKKQIVENSPSGKNN